MIFKLKEDLLMEMSNVRGRDCKVEDINFSFYFSPAQGSHSIRAKVLWNRDRMTGSPDGCFELFGDYKYRPYRRTLVSEQEIANARRFFRKYKVLFAACWENVLDPVDLRNYFEGRISFDELKTCFFGIKNYKELQKAETIKQLGQIVKDLKIFRI